MKYSFAQIVCEVQAAYGLDDEELAQRVGVHRTTISRLRTRSVLMPSYEVGAKLVKLHDDRFNLKKVAK